MITQFSWLQQWYPIIPLSYLDSTKPTEMELLGKKLVIWQDNQQIWRVMDGICPHKLASLSFGKIKEDGTLMCRHHGWCFNSQGKCTEIPMLKGSDAEKNACESRRSQLNSYPTQIKQKLLLVWLDNSLEGIALSQEKSPAILPELENFAQDWYMSDVPLDYKVSLETSFDPSHAQFLHEGLGFVSENTIPIKYFATEGKISAEKGFTLKHSGYNTTNEDMDASRTFTPPCSNTTIYRYKNGKKFISQLYFVPTRPGYCRYIVKFIIEGMTTPKKSFLDILPQDLRQGLKHSFSYKLADQDVTIMHSQQQNEYKYDKTWQKSYFMPSPADIGIVTFRKWLDEYANGNPSYEYKEAKIPQITNEEHLYDRWHRHSKNCPSCRQSLVLIEDFRKKSYTSSVVFSLLTLILILTSIIVDIPVQIPFISTILAVLSVLLSRLTDDWRHSFLSSIPKKGLPVLNLFKN